MKRLMITGVKTALIALLVVTASPASTGEQVYGKGLLWRIKPADGPSSHIFGTIHMTDKRVLHLPEAVRQVFTESASLALEIERTHDMPYRAAKLMLLSNGEQLSDILGKNCSHAWFGRRPHSASMPRYSNG